MHRLRHLLRWLLGEPRPRSRRRQMILDLEALDRRDCPSLVLSFGVTYGAGRQITMSGRVDGLSGPMASIGFTGAASANVIPGADGTFSVTVTAIGLGTVQGQASDMYGNRSNVATATLTSTAPAITDFRAIYEGDSTYVFQGRVVDESPVGLYVVFGGLPSLQSRWATTAADGSFSLTVTLTAGETGTVTAQVTDPWSLTSGPTTTLV